MNYGLRNSMSVNNLLLFGCDFFKEKKSSEINFWNDMISVLADHFEEIVILSVNNRNVSKEIIGNNIYLYNIPPYYFGKSGRGGNSEITAKGFNKLPFATFYKSYTFYRLQPLFDQLIKQHNIGIIHYMRVFGLFNEWLIKRYPQIVFSITVPTHIDRGFPLHLLYHYIKNAAIKPMTRIVPTSEATHRKLVKLGVPSEKLRTIHWSTKIADEPESKIDIRSEFSLVKKTEIILWSGPLQDASEKEFLFSLSVAEKFLKKSNRFSFIFAFKPSRLKPAFMNMVKENPFIRIFETDFQTFCALKRGAVLFLSPVCNKNRTVAPAITWIEMMQLGLPVMTTDVDGVAELITHQENGFVVNDINDAVCQLLEFQPSEQLKEKCRNTIFHKFNIDKLAKQYIDMWQNVF